MRFFWLSSCDRGWEAAKEGSAIVQTDHPHVGALKKGASGRSVFCFFDDSRLVFLFLLFFKSLFLVFP